MIFWVIFLIILTALLQKYILPDLTAKQKFYLTLTIGVLVISLSIGSYLSSREPNLYEQLNITRNTPNEKILELLKSREDLSQYYDEVKNHFYEIRCLNSTDPDWVTDSFKFYGTSLLVVNFVSFFNTASSRLMLLVILASLILEFCFFSKNLTLTFLNFTSCEFIEILRRALPGLAFIAALLAIVKKDHLIDLKKKFTQRLCQADEDLNELEQLVRQETIFDQIDACDIVRRVVEEDIKKDVIPNNSKKYFKYFFAGYLIYSVFSPTLK